MTRQAVFVIILVTLFIAAGARAAETFDAVTRRIGEQAGKIRSLRCHVQDVSEQTGEGVTETVTTESRVEVVRGPRGCELQRIESRVAQVTRDPQAGEQRLEGTTLEICDGTFVYRLKQIEDTQAATKNRIDPHTPGFLDIRRQFEQLSREADLRLLPAEKVDGREAYAIEAVPRRKDLASPFGRIVCYVDKTTLVPIKTILYDARGRLCHTRVFRDIEVNVAIPPQRFVFAAPPGVQVMDMTRIEPPADEDGAEPAPPEQADE